MKSKPIVLLKSLQQLISSNYPVSQIIELIFLQKIISEKEYKFLNNQSTKGIDMVTQVINLCLNKRARNIYEFFSIFNSPSVAIGLTYTLLDKEQQILSHVFKKLLYPVILFFTSYLFIILSKFILFQKLFDLSLSMNISTSHLTICLLIINMIFLVMTLLILLVIACVIVFYLFSIDKLKLDSILFLSKIKMIKQILILYVTYYFTLYFISLIKYSISTKNIFKFLNKQITEKFMLSIISDCTKQLEKGFDIVHVVNQQIFFDSYFKKMFHIGLASGELETTLFHFVDNYEKEIERKIIRLALLIQYMLFALVAFIIIFIYYSMLMPLLDITTQF